MLFYSLVLFSFYVFHVFVFLFLCSSFCQYIRSCGLEHTHVELISHPYVLYSIYHLSHMYIICEIDRFCWIACWCKSYLLQQRHLERNNFWLKWDMYSIHKWNKNGRKLKLKKNNETYISNYVVSKHVLYTL